MGRITNFVSPLSAFGGISDQQFEEFLDQCFPPADNRKPPRGYVPSAAVKPASVATPAAKPAAPAVPKFSAAEQSQRELCGMFIQLFGDEGGQWFADGKSLKECYAIQDARKEAALPNAKRVTLAVGREYVAKLGERQQPENKSPLRSDADLSDPLPAGLSKFANGLRFAKPKSAI